MVRSKGVGGDSDADSKAKNMVFFNDEWLNGWMNIMKMMIFLVEFEGVEGG